MKNYSKSLFLILPLIAASTAFADIRAVTPDNWGNKPNSWQMKRHNLFKERIAKGAGEVVFIGDSITHFWENKASWKKHFGDGPRKALNLGISADRTEHVLWRITEGGELDGYEAKVVVILIGTNNAGHHSFEKEPPVDTVHGIRKIIHTVRAKQPKARILLTAIFPRGESGKDSNRRRNEVVNGAIREFCDGRTVVWCDFNDALVDENGDSKKYFHDRLHPSDYGYEVIENMLVPIIDEALKTPLDKPIKGRVSSVKGKLEPAAMRPISYFKDSKWWYKRTLEKRNEILSGPKEYDIVFVGDSITHRWERKGGEGVKHFAELKKQYKILNLGYGGDRTQHVLWRMKNGELEGYKAKLFMLMIGTNNNGDKPKDIAEGIRRIIATIKEKHPESKIMLLPIFPRGADANDVKRRRNEAVNNIIKFFADGEKVIWVDFNDKLVDAKGDTKKFMNDRLHTNHKGYGIWRKAVVPYFKEIVGK